MNDMSASEHGVTVATPAPAVRAGVLQRTIVSVMPWCIIGGLLYAGFFVELEPVGQTVQPPALEARDQYYGVAAPATDVIWMAGSYGKVVRSDDGGRSWVRQDTPHDAHLQDIAAWDAQRAVAVGNGGRVIVTGDGGRHWQEVEVPRNEIANKLIKVVVRAGGRAWAVGEFGTLLHSSDFGRSWARLGEPRDLTYADVAPLDDGRLVVAGEFGRVFASDDGGARWTEITTPVSSSLTALAFRDPRNGVAVGLEGVVLVTRDGGRTWQRHERTPTGIVAGSEGSAYASAPVRRQELVGDIVSEHLLAVAWVPASEQWLAVGNKGVVTIGSADMRQWQTRQLGPRDVAWHTGLAVAGERVIVSGKNAGIWNAGRWSVFFDRRGLVRE